jgi:hypothetical protein
MGIKPPLPMFWMEVEGVLARRGKTEGISPAWFFHDGRMMGLAGIETGERLIVVPFGLISLGQVVDGEAHFENCKTRTGQRMIDDGVFTEADHSEFLMMGFEPMGLLGNNRHVSTKRIIRYGDDAIGRRWRRRRFQQGRPIYSYNQVDLVLPQTCIHRGEVVEAKSLAGKRGHMVIGHWRLIPVSPNHSLHGLMAMNAAIVAWGISPKSALCLAAAKKGRDSWSRMFQGPTANVALQRQSQVH